MEETAAPRPLASVFNRALALLLDAIIVSIPAIALSHLMPFAGGILIGVLYWPLLEASELRATLGKYALGLQVTDLQGGRLSLQTSFIRYGMKIVSSAICFLGYLPALFSERKQALHDMVAGTLVVYGKSSQPVGEAWLRSAQSAAQAGRSALGDVVGADESTKLAQLERLQALRERGALTEEEFVREKAKILS